METSACILGALAALSLIFILSLSAYGVANCLGKILNEVVNKAKNRKFYFWSVIRLCVCGGLGALMLFVMGKVAEKEFVFELGKIYLALILYFFGSPVCRLLAKKYAAKTFLKYESTFYITTYSFIAGIFMGVMFRLPWYLVIGAGVSLMLISGGISVLVRQYLIKKRNCRISSPEMEAEKAKVYQQIKDDLAQRDNFELMILYSDMLKKLEPSGHHCSCCTEKRECAYSGTNEFSGNCENGCKIVQKIVEEIAALLTERGCELPSKDENPIDLLEKSGCFGMCVSISISVEDDAD